MIFAYRISSVRKFLHSYSGQLIGNAFAIIGTGAVIWDNHVGRNHAANNFDTKLEGLNTKFDTKLDKLSTKFDTKFDKLSTKFDKLSTKVDKLSTKVDELSTKLETEIQACQYHTMNALDGNKKPMRDWLQRLERCKQSGEDCDDP